MKKVIAAIFVFLLVLSCCSASIFASTDAEEIAGDENSASILGFNAEFGVFMLDTENQLAGSGCASYEFAGEIISGGTLEKSIDISGYDAIEFDFYVSDVSILQTMLETNGQLELSSSGASDQNELFWPCGAIAQGIEGEAKQGWNHVVLYINAARYTFGEPDLTTINFFRFYMIATPLETPITIKFDNLRAVNRRAQQAAGIIQKASEFVNKIQPFVDAGVTAENYEAYKAAVTEARAYYDALDDYGVETFGADTFAVIREGEKALTTYERTLVNTQAPTPTATAQNSGATQQSVPPATTPDAQEPEGNSNMGLIIGIIIGVIVIVAVVVVVVKKKKS